MTQTVSKDKESFVFEIISAKVCEEPDKKKHLIYTLQVRHLSGSEDLSPSVIYRRYTHFLNLYESLKKEYPELMTTVIFPKKVFLGNFDDTLISTRSEGFESLLKHICQESRLRMSNSLLAFLQEEELIKANILIKKEYFIEAYPILENIFLLLNKVLTDRSSAVLLALSRIVGCCALNPTTPKAQSWANLALQRFEGVSDSDLLLLYGPILLTCLKLEPNSQDIQRRLQDMKQLGMKIEEPSNLLNVIKTVEILIEKH